MSAAVKQFHEEEAIGKTYDLQVARRLLRYLKPYARLLVPALIPLCTGDGSAPQTTASGSLTLASSISTRFAAGGG